MIISDLSYLESATKNVVGGGAYSNAYDFRKKIAAQVSTNLDFVSNTYVNDSFTKFGNLKFDSHVTGTSSSLAFDNEAVGPYSNTQGAFNQGSVAGEASFQNGLFVSAANYPKSFYY